jgi:hypothetical protein
VNIWMPRSSPEVAAGDRRWLVIAATAILAVVIGVSVASTNWILTLGLLAMTILLLRPREVCLAVYAFLLPFDMLSAVGPAGITLTSIAGAGLAAVLLGTALVKRDLQRPPRQAIWWVLLVVWVAATILWALDGESAISRLPTAISLLVVYLVALSANITSKELRTASIFAVAGGCAASLYTIYLFYRGAGYHHGFRATLMAGDKAADPNLFAATLLLPLSLAVHGFLTPRRWLARLGWLAVAATLSFGILVTGSRGGLVAVAAMILFYMYVRQVSRLMTIPFVAIFVALALLLPNAFYARLETTAETGGAGRTTVWQGGLVAFENHALVGAGVNNFSNAYRENRSAPIYRHNYVIGAHNTYLETAVEGGVIGFALLMTAFGSHLRAASRRRKNLPIKAGRIIIPYEAACYSILVAAFFIGVIWDKWFWMAWILLAVAVRTATSEELAGDRVAASEPVALPWQDVRI